MVFDAKDQYESQWAAIVSIADKIGCTAETLRCPRAQRDDILMVEIERVWQVNQQVYGADKVWR